MKEAIELLRKEVNPLNGTLYLSRTATESLLKILDEVAELIESYKRVIEVKKTHDADDKVVW